MGAKEPGDKTEPSSSPFKSKLKTSKDVHFSVLPDKYEPLVEERDEEEEREDAEERQRRKEEKKRKKKMKYKKYRKVEVHVMYQIKLKHCEFIIN